MADGRKTYTDPNTLANVLNVEVAWSAPVVASAVESSGPLVYATTVNGSAPPPSYLEAHPEKTIQLTEETEVIPPSMPVHMGAPMPSGLPTLARLNEEQKETLLYSDAMKAAKTEYELKLERSYSNNNRDETYQQEIVTLKEKVEAHDTFYEKLNTTKQALTDGSFCVHTTFPVSPEDIKEAEELVAQPNWRSQVSNLVQTTSFSGPKATNFDSVQKAAHVVAMNKKFGAEEISKQYTILLICFMLYGSIVASILVFVAGANGSLRVTPTLIGGSAYLYQPGQPFPVATRGFYARQGTDVEVEVDVNTYWYLEPWELRPYQGLCPVRLHSAQRKKEQGSLYEPNDNSDKKWNGCIRRTSNPADELVFQLMDIANLPKVTKFSESWENYTRYYKIAKDMSIYLGCFGLMFVPNLFFMAWYLAIDKIFDKEFPRIMGCFFCFQLAINLIPSIELYKMVYLLRSSSFLLSDSAWQGFFPGCKVSVEWMDGGNCAVGACFIFLMITGTLLCCFVFTSFHLRPRKIYLLASMIESYRQDAKDTSWEKAILAGETQRIDQLILGIQNHSLETPSELINQMQADKDKYAKLDPRYALMCKAELAVALGLPLPLFADSEVPP